MEWYLEAFRKYAQFEGRSRRKEYWMFTLGNVIVMMACGVLAAILVPGFAGRGGEASGASLIVPMGLLGLFLLATIIPSLAVTVRRLHDTNRSGWWFFISFVPYIGPLILLVFTLQDSHPGANEYGPNPKALAVPA